MLLIILLGTEDRSLLGQVDLGIRILTGMEVKPMTCMEILYQPFLLGLELGELSWNGT